MSQEFNKRYQISILITLLNPFTHNRISHSSQLDHSIFVLRGVRWHFSFLFRIFIEHSEANSGYPNQTPCSAVSDLGLHDLPMSHKKGR